MKRIPIVASNPQKGVQCASSDDALLVEPLYPLLRVLLRADLMKPCKIARRALGHGLSERDAPVVVPVDEYIPTLGGRCRKEVIRNDSMNLGSSRLVGSTSQPRFIVALELVSFRIRFVHDCVLSG